MNLNDTVYVIHRASFYGQFVANSISIMPAKIISMGTGIVVEIQLSENKVVVTPIPEDQIFPTVAKALEQAQTTLTDKLVATIKSSEDES